VADPRHQRGARGEAAAVKALEDAGYRVIERNFRCRGGEIDVVAEHGETLCFVEVRTRRRGAMVDGRASIDHRKRRKVARAARFYCAAHVVAERPMRFDVVDVQASEDGRFATEILRNAFDATGGL